MKVNNIIIYIFICSLVLLTAFGRKEQYVDKLYGVTFPEVIKSSQVPPQSIEYGIITQTGTIVSIGNFPFVRTALKVIKKEEVKYYILNDVYLPPDISFARLQGNLIITPIYLINNQLATIEYHLHDINILETY